MKDVAAPRKAIIHIQNTAPGPPKAIAVATPPMLPMPTRLASDIIRDWNDEVPSADFSPTTSCLSMSGIPVTCTNRVRRVKYTPASRHRITSGSAHTTAVSAVITSAKVMSTPRRRAGRTRYGRRSARRAGKERTRPGGRASEDVGRGAVRVRTWAEEGARLIRATVRSGSQATVGALAAGGIVAIRSASAVRHKQV